MHIQAGSYHEETAEDSNNCKLEVKQDHGDNLRMPNGPVKLPGPQTRGCIVPRKTAASVNFNALFGVPARGR
jgi:hypothetical protein